jgi:hypothetical protein
MHAHLVGLIEQERLDKHPDGYMIYLRDSQKFSKSINAPISIIIDFKKNNPEFKIMYKIMRNKASNKQYFDITCAKQLYRYIELLCTKSF